MCINEIKVVIFFLMLSKRVVNVQERFLILALNTGCVDQQTNTFASQSCVMSSWGGGKNEADGKQSNFVCILLV